MWDKNNYAEVACSLASLIILENNIKLSDENFEKIFKSTNIKLEVFWYTWFFSKILIENNQSEIKIENLPKIKEKALDSHNQNDNHKNKKLKEDTEDTEEDMGFGLFD
jgi:ribosomal protein L12E/L44/L45/RPP1/RPP2